MQEIIPILPQSIVTLASELVKLYETKYKIIKPSVESIIKRRIKDRHIIEYYLDECMDILTVEGYELFSKLCNYYATIDYMASMEYIAIYNEINGYDTMTTKRKKL